MASLLCSMEPASGKPMSMCAVGEAPFRPSNLSRMSCVDMAAAAAGGVSERLDAMQDETVATSGMEDNHSSEISFLSLTARYCLSSGHRTRS